ncbi:multidrug efflux SMR transporter [Reyranella sp. CPCC 100927]|uniref:DMT family transporter n=1 Tax=Reyranella sp. CPCC 100927 TaxID=2599616 RepID=UPI0011B84EE1|nr:multidrug efflux SMR transporter [Reyranella sp. CPCC 100927]TWT11802.1 multidrug efflux SMR transporter [Reyranella sp. CPCC 100927]
MSNSVAWLFLVLSGIADVVWAVATKYAAGYTRLGWTAVSVVALIVFLGLLTQALKILPLGTAYAVWTGIGAVGSVLAGLLLFGEAMTAARLMAIVAIVGGVVALKVLPS